MMSSQQTDSGDSQGVLHKYACSLCARRKVKCNKAEPCSNCQKSQVQCIYEAPAPPRPRKRAADEDLLVRLARYEDLMRKNNINFGPQTTAWIPSGLEAKMKKGEPQREESVWSTTTYAPEDAIINSERCLWSDLSAELKHPPIQSLRHKYDPFLHPTPPLQSILGSTQPKLQDLHPDPRNIYRFWQIFVESVNPLIKIVHVPTLQQRVLDASWDVSHISKPLNAIMFAIYTLAVTTMSAEECQSSLGETRSDLLTRYRSATLRALVAADFLTTRDYEVLLALALFLFADPESELTATLAGTAERLGHMMGLHRDHLVDARFSFFERQLRLRLWWQICALNSRSRTVYTGFKPSLSDFNDLPLPLNVNDADLHPDMTEPPTQHDNPTEMVCILMKFGVSNWFRKSPTAHRVFNTIAHAPMRDWMTRKLEDEAIDELEAIYEDKYYQVCDEQIPLHGMTITMAKLTIARMRFKIHHPRGQVGVSGGGAYMTKEEGDIMFEAALTTLQMTDEGMRSIFASHLFTSTHMTASFQLDAYIYVISDLRRRCAGERVDIAWKIVENLYNEHPEIINDSDNTFFVALGDLTLEAWEARRKELVTSHGAREEEITPNFVRLLWDKRQPGIHERVHMPPMVDPDSLGALGLTDDNGLDWAYWNDFLQL